MGGRHPNHRLVKLHFTYTVKEIARRLDMHQHTVRRWLQDGLVTIDDRRRPVLIRGQDLVDFLKCRRDSAKRGCPPGHIYCVKCRVPRMPAGDIAGYIPMTPTSGNLEGICPE